MQVIYIITLHFPFNKISNPSTLCKEEFAFDKKFASTEPSLFSFSDAVANGKPLLIVVQF
jgi:hypothetical protein